MHDKASGSVLSRNDDIQSLAEANELFLSAVKNRVQ